MRTSHLMEDLEVDSMIDQLRSPLEQLYKNVKQERKSVQKSGNYSKLWARVAPAGDIYRYIGLRMERLRHCKDLGKQLIGLAEEHGHLLGGDTKHGKVEHLLGLLRATKQRCLSTEGQDMAKDELNAEEGAQDADGFLPLMEFLNDWGIAESNHFVASADLEQARIWRRNHFMGIMIALIQIVAPVLIILHCWYSEGNPLKERGKPFDMEYAIGLLTIHETFCFGRSVSAKLTTVMGTLMLFIVHTIILTYAQNEKDCATKSSRLPVENFWLCLGTMANASCCLCISIAIPLEFWNEDGPTGIIMNSMALLFIFSLDDLSGGALAFIGEDDASFQRSVAWEYALLSQCPVQLRDIVRPSATMPEELWSITYDQNGRLINTRNPDALHGVEPGLLLTRVSLLCEDETSPLVQKDKDIDALVPRTRYQVVNGGRVLQLPGIRGDILPFIWMIVCLLLHIVWWVSPVFWFIINKPCRDEPAS